MGTEEPTEGSPSQLEMTDVLPGHTLTHRESGKVRTLHCTRFIQVSVALQQVFNVDTSIAKKVMAQVALHREKLIQIQRKRMCADEGGSTRAESSEAWQTICSSEMRAAKN
eukprot:EG_transcript_50883